MFPSNKANCVLSILSFIDSKIQSHTHFSTSLNSTAVEVIGFQPFIDCGRDLLGIAATGIFSRVLTLLSLRWHIQDLSTDSDSNADPEQALLNIFREMTAWHIIFLYSVTI